MSANAEEIENNLTETLASNFAGHEVVETGEEEEVEHYEFDTDFQFKIATLAMRDQMFARQVQGLIRPEYFEDAAVASLVNLALEHWDKYKQLPSSVVAYKQVLQDALNSNKIRTDLKSDVIATFKKMWHKTDLTDRDFVADKVAEFARHQAIYKAMMRSSELMSKHQFDQIADMINKASMVGINRADSAYNYFETIEERSAARKDKVAGIKPPQGITTGVPKIDKLLYHEGWGRNELSVLLGGAKAGKSTGLLFFAQNASLAGHNVLYVTLEMSADIASSRLDACISEIEMKELENNIGAVELAVRTAQKKAGPLYVAEFPTGSLSPSGLRRLIDTFGAEGMFFDMIVVDYLDLMTPDYRTNDAIENSKNIYVGVRAIAQEYNVVMLSATQSNREGFKSVTVKAEHVAEDFNKVRIADLIISINITEDERTRGEARLYFAASRNQAGGMMVQIKQDLERMTFIKHVIGII